MTGFNEETTTEAKRHARGHHWELTQKLLRDKDNAHNRAWKIMIVAGPTPEEEIKHIKFLMPRARIMAVDEDMARASRALDAGATVALNINLNWREQKIGNDGHSYRVPPAIVREFGQFDAICLDLTGPASNRLRSIVDSYQRIVNARGIYMVTFCYGRDVIESIEGVWSRAVAANNENLRFLPSNVPEGIRQRVYFILRHRVRDLRSVVRYNAGMPMITMLAQKLKPNMPEHPPVTFHEVPDGAMQSEDEEERRARRSAAAHKAVATRRANQHARNTANGSEQSGRPH
jgi:hypothetical protein